MAGSMTTVTGSRHGGARIILSGCVLLALLTLFAGWTPTADSASIQGNTCRCKRELKNWKFANVLAAYPTTKEYNDPKFDASRWCWANSCKGKVDPFACICTYVNITNRIISDRIDAFYRSGNNTKFVFKAYAKEISALQHIRYAVFEKTFRRTKCWWTQSSSVIVYEGLDYDVAIPRVSIRMNEYVAQHLLKQCEGIYFVSEIEKRIIFYRNIEPENKNREFFMGNYWMPGSGLESLSIGSIPELRVIKKQYVADEKFDTVEPIGLVNTWIDPHLGIATPQEERLIILIIICAIFIVVMFHKLVQIALRPYIKKDC